MSFCTAIFWSCARTGRVLVNGTLLCCIRAHITLMVCLFEFEGQEKMHVYKENLLHIILLCCLQHHLHCKKKEVQMIHSQVRRAAVSAISWKQKKCCEITYTEHDNTFLVLSQLQSHWQSQCAMVAFDDGTHMFSHVIASKHTHQCLSTCHARLAS